MNELLKVKKSQDFGKTLNLSFINIKNYSLFQIGFYFDDYPGGFYAQASVGMGKLFGFLVGCWKFSFDVDLIAPTWREWDAEEEK